MVEPASVVDPVEAQDGDTCKFGANVSHRKYTALSKV